MSCEPKRKGDGTWNNARETYPYSRATLFLSFVKGWIEFGERQIPEMDPLKHDRHNSISFICPSSPIELAGRQECSGKKRRRIN